MSIRSNAAVIYSETSRKALAIEAKKEGRVYAFRGSRRKLHWIQGEKAYLAVNGLASILRRIGIKFDIINEEECLPEVLKEYNYIFCPNACHLSETTIANVEKWLQGKRILVVSGDTNLPAQLLGIDGSTKHIPKGFCGIEWLPSLKFNPKHETYVFSPPGYSVRITNPEKGYVSLGKLIEYRDMQEVNNTVYLEGDAIIVGEKTIYFTIPIFEYIGGVLQGHLCIEPLRKLLKEESNFYVDVLAWYIKNVLAFYGCERLWEIKLRPWGKYDNILVLRHDTDYSADPSYLNYESENRIPATYAILPDQNRDFYLSQIAAQPFIEASYHFSSKKHGKPDKKAIAGKGLTKQVRKAKKKFGIPVVTVHKHGNSFFYPETIEAMDYLYEHLPETIGIGTMFRFNNLKYSNNEPESFTESYVVEHPNVSIPFWFPFKMVASTVGYSKILRGWDTTHFMEPDPFLVDLIFRNSSALPDGVYTLGFHPAHAKRDTFNPGGNFEWFLYAVNEAKNQGWWIANYKMVCQRLNDWENLIFRVQDDLIILENSTDNEIRDIVINNEGKPIKRVSCESKEVTLLERFIYIPVIKAKSIMEIRLN